MAYSDLIYQPGFPTNKRQGNTSIYFGVTASGVACSGVIQRGDPVDYSGWVTAYSGKFRQQNVT